MTDVKISALPSATTPLTGTEILPIVQGGTTDQVSVANLTAGRAVSAASLTLTTTPLGVASGGTGLTSLTAGYIPYGNGTSAFSSSSGLYFDGSNLGIGTTSPVNKLEIHSNTTADCSLYFSNDYSGAAYAANIKLNAANTSGANYNGLFCLSNGTVNWQIYGAGSSNTIAFATGSSSTERMRIDSSGNVGIGTQTPGSYGKLAIIDATAASIVNSTSSTNGYSFVQLQNTGSGGRSWQFATGGSASIYNGGFAIFDYTALATRLFVDSSGNVLIGTTVAGTLLTVNGVGTLCSGTATPAGGSTSARLLFGTTAGFGIYYGSGAPTVSAAQGSIYLRSDGSSTSTRMYVNTTGSTTWTNVTTAA